MLSGFSLIHINNQHKLWLKKKEIIFVQDNLSEVYEVLSVFCIKHKDFGNWKIKTYVYVADL